VAALAEVTLDSVKHTLSLSEINANFLHRLVIF